jgi:YVTN family beta-propeller protein
MFKHIQRFVLFLVLPLPAPSHGQTQSSVPEAAEPILHPEITKIAVGFGPQGIAFTTGAAWVAYGNAKEFGVARIDTATNQVVARIATGRWPVGAAAGEGSVWIVNRDENTVSRIDPESNRVVATIHVGKKPIGIEVAEGSVWVTNSGAGTVTRIDPHSNTVIASVHVGAAPFGVTCSHGAVWVVNSGRALSYSGSLEIIDPKSNVVARKIKIPWSNVVLAHGDDVWVGTLEGHVIRVDARSGAILKRLALGPIGGLAASNDAVWAVTNTNGWMWKINAQNDSVTGRVYVGNRPIIFGPGADSDGAIWVSSVDDGTVLRVNPEDPDHR